jgi:hypothetical protein
VKFNRSGMKDFIRSGQKASTKTVRRIENGRDFKRVRAPALACELHTKSHAGFELDCQPTARSFILLVPAGEPTSRPGQFFCGIFLSPG